MCNDRETGTMLYCYITHVLANGGAYEKKHAWRSAMRTIGNSVEKLMVLIVRGSCQALSISKTNAKRSTVRANYLQTVYEISADISIVAEHWLQTDDIRMKVL